MDIPEDRGRGDNNIVLPRPLGCPKGNKEGLQGKVSAGWHTDFANGPSAYRSGLFSIADIQPQEGIRDIP